MNQSLKGLIAYSAYSYEKIKENSLKGGVYLYGAGFIGAWTLTYLERVGVPVVAFVDSNPKRWGSDYLGKKIISPQDKELTASQAILITSRHAVSKIKSILSDLTDAPVMSIDAFSVHEQGQDAIISLEDLFSCDLKSLETLYAVLTSMLQGTTHSLEKCAESQPYFNRYGFFNRMNEVYVDAGAYVGDSLERFIWSVNGVFKEIHAFEPSKPQFNAMSERVRRLLVEWGLNSEKVMLVNKALSSGSTVENFFKGDSSTQNRVVRDRGVVAHDDKAFDSVSTTSIDEYFGDENLSLIKVDVEGSEKDLLIGASATIRRCRPRMALSVYHFPTDIFTLPLECRRLNEDYTFALGHHSSQLIETVLYCRDKSD